MRQHEDEVREIGGHVVRVDRVPETRARAGVDHHRHAVLRGNFVERRQLRKIVAIGVRAESLMRRVDLETAEPEILDEPPRLLAHAARVPRVNGAESDQPPPIA